MEGCMEDSLGQLFASPRGHFGTSNLEISCLLPQFSRGPAARGDRATTASQQQKQKRETQKRKYCCGRVSGGYASTSRRPERTSCVPSFPPLPGKSTRGAPDTSYLRVVRLRSRKRLVSNAPLLRSHTPRRQCCNLSNESRPT